MKILAISDLHSYLPDTKDWPEADVFIDGGDSQTDYDLPIEKTIQFQREELLEKFNPWLDNIKAKRKICIGGNHNHLMDKDPKWVKENLKAEFVPWGNLEIDNVKFHFTSYSYQPPNYTHPWSFGQSEEGLAELYKQIPEDTNVLVSHTPAYGCFDCGYSGQQKMENFGSISLKRYLQENPLPQLKLMITSHVHEWGGQSIFYRVDKDRGFIMTSVCADPHFNIEQRPMLFEI